MPGPQRKHVFRREKGQTLSWHRIYTPILEDKQLEFNVGYILGTNKRKKGGRGGGVSSVCAWP